MSEVIRSIVIMCSYSPVCLKYCYEYSENRIFDDCEG